MAVEVLLVDDHALLRRGLRSLLEIEDDIEVVGEAGRADEARDRLAQLRPDVALLDVVLPDGDGIQICRETPSLSPSTARVMLTAFPEPRAMVSAALAGAAAYLSKQASGDDVVDVVRAAAAGERLIDLTDVVERLDEMPANGNGALEQLTPQERRVFELIGLGHSNRGIAEQLDLGETTVRNYVSRVLAKLEMERRTEAAALAARLSERRAIGDARRGHDPRNGLRISAR